MTTHGGSSPQVRAGGVSLLYLRSWSIHWLFGRPRRRFQLCSGGWPSQINMTPECLVCWRIFGKPGNLTEDRIPTAFYEIRHRAKTGARCTSEFLMWSCQRILDIWRWHIMWKASRRRSSAESTVHVSQAYENR